jgi:N-acetylglucosaminyldiphosphoundecaprenol N-acetyl-beta-D-mannosaminyltransferase
MLAVGAAFDYLAGVLTRPPDWMQRAGLEWLHRLVQEPRRLWRRYLITNSQFLLRFLPLWLATKMHAREAA